MFVYQVTFWFRRDSLSLAQIAQYVTRAANMDRAIDQSLGRFIRDQDGMVTHKTSAVLIDGDWIG